MEGWTLSVHSGGFLVEGVEQISQWSSGTGQQEQAMRQGIRIYLIPEDWGPTQNKADKTVASMGLL